MKRVYFLKKRPADLGHIATQECCGCGADEVRLLRRWRIETEPDDPSDPLVDAPESIIAEDFDLTPVEVGGVDSGIRFPEDVFIQKISMDRDATRVPDDGPYQQCLSDLVGFRIGAEDEITLFDRRQHGRVDLGK